MRKGFFSDREKRLSILFLLRWLFIATASALIAAATIRTFIFLLNHLLTIIKNLPVPLFVWPLAGALICGLLIYRICPDARGEGLPSYIHGLKHDHGRLDPCITVFKYPAAFAALASLGTGGLVGPLGRINAGILSSLLRKQKLVQFLEIDIRNATICGLAATVGVLTHSAVGGGIFAVEVIQRANLRYRDLFPAIIASSFAAVISRTMGWTPFFPINAPAEQYSWTIIPVIILVGLFGGLTGKLYISMYRKTAGIMKREQKSGIFIKAMTGSLAAALPAWLIHHDLIGTSRTLSATVLSGQNELLYNWIPAAVPVFAILLVFMLMKMYANCLTVGSGMSAGFTAPAALCGIFLGAAAASLFGLPADSAGFYALVAAGFSSVLASVMNVPIAAAVIALELFGLHYGSAAALAALIAFQVNRQDTIYDERYPGC